MRYEGIIDEILYYGERSKDGRLIIPITVDWDKVDEIMTPILEEISVNLNKVRL